MVLSYETDLKRLDNCLRVHSVSIRPILASYQRYLSNNVIIADQEITIIAMTRH